MLDFLYYPIAFVLKAWHALWSTIIDPASGAAWVLSIMFLVFTLRILLFPIFVKMIKGQRAMQELQPEIAKLKEEFGKDRQGMSEAMMKLQKERGVNPLASCLPMLVQAPVFIALLHVLRRLGPEAKGLYSWSDSLTQQAAVARIFGAPISSHFGSLFGTQFLGGKDNNAALIAALPGTTMTDIRWVTGVLIVVMCTTQFFSTRQLMKRSATSGQAATGQMQMVQKLMLYGAPVMLLFSGTIFPLGVLVYWFVNNLWTIGQQFWVLKKMPPPAGSTASAELDFEVDPAKLAPRPGAKPQRKPISKSTALALADDEDNTERLAAPEPTEEPAKVNERPTKPARAAGSHPVKPVSTRPGGKPKPSSSAKSGTQSLPGSKTDPRRRNKR